MEISKRFIIVTGKGGVGKSTLSLALAGALKSNSQEVLLVNIEEDFPTWVSSEYSEILQTLRLKESAEGYVAQKLGSATIAGWVTSTPFFKAVLGMLPGFSYVIYLGYLMEKLHANPNLIIILDSPSSGHAITMLEACWNFKKVFGVGALSDDLEKVLKFLYQEDILKIVITCLPGELPIAEGLELKSYLKELKVSNITLVLNNSLSDFVAKNNLRDDLPPSLLEKCMGEESALLGMKDQFNFIVPLIPEIDEREKVLALAKFMSSHTYLETKNA